MNNLPAPWIFVPALAAWCLFLSAPIFQRFADDRPARLASVDGLRGFLALAVLGHHFAITAQWQQTGKWEITPSPTWNLMGQASVTVFFMITGLLFFGRIRAPKRPINFGDFLRGRVFRIYPVYLLACAAVLIMALSVTSMESVPPMEATKQAYHWLTFQPSKLLAFDDAGLAIAYTPWSLRYEWCFYFALPFLFFAWRALKFSGLALCGLGVVAMALVHYPVHIPVLDVQTTFFAPFVLGGIVSLLPVDSPLGRLIRGPAGTASVLICVVCLLTSQSSAYRMSSYLLLFMAFIPVALGNTLLGWLTSRPMQIAGAISYDIYLLHGILLYAAYHLAWPQALSINSTVAAAQLGVTGLSVLVVSLLVHRLVERPLILQSSRLIAVDPRERLAAP